MESVRVILFTPRETLDSLSSKWLLTCTWAELPVQSSVATSSPLSLMDLRSRHLRWCLGIKPNSILQNWFSTSVLQNIHMGLAASIKSPPHFLTSSWRTSEIPWSIWTWAAQSSPSSLHGKGVSFMIIKKSCWIHTALAPCLQFILQPSPTWSVVNNKAGTQVTTNSSCVCVCVRACERVSPRASACTAGRR